MFLTWTAIGSICLILCTLSGPLRAATIQETFDVATGNVPGSCDPFLEFPDEDFQEAMDMGKAGDLALRRAIRGSLNQRGRRMLAAMFGIVIESEGEEPDDSDRTSLGEIQTIFAAVRNADVLKNIGASFFCSGEIMTFTTKVIDPETNEPTDRPITDVLPNEQNGAYWFPAKKGYATTSTVPPGGEGDNPCSGDTGGFVNKKFEIIVICYESLESAKWRTTLRNVKANQHAILPGENGDQLYRDFKSIPGAFLHELSHLVSRAVKDQPAHNFDGSLQDPPSLSYGFNDCFVLGDQFPALAQRNADTFHIFGMAMFLNEWDWALGFAQDPSTLQ